MLSLDNHSTADGHDWAVMSGQCELADTNQLVRAVVSRYRNAYGEADLVQLLEETPDLLARFDPSAILTAFRLSLPDASIEAGKPKQLANYRSEVAEVVARIAMEQAHKIEFPTEPQFAKFNPNQPILGFDGWGFLQLDERDIALVLIQVKGTDDLECPPKEATKLAKECQQAPTKIAEICRVLAYMAVRLRGTRYAPVAIGWLAVIGANKRPSIVVAPAIIRGKTGSRSQDLEPVREVIASIAPVRCRGLTLSLGVDLGEFGLLISDLARKSRDD